MKGQRIPDETQLAAVRYAEVHGDDAAAAKFECAASSLPTWRKKFGFKQRSKAPKNPRNRYTKPRELEFFED